MATIAEHVSKIRLMIKEYTDDTVYTDEALYKFFRDAVNMFQYRKSKRWEYLSEQNFQEYCIALEKGVSHDCDCVDVGCPVLKTVHPIPTPLANRLRDLMVIKTLGGRKLRMQSEEYRNTESLDDIKKDKPFYDLINKHITIFNYPEEWKAIRVRGIFEDPTEWAGIQLCDPKNGGDLNESCFDIENSDFPVDTELIIPSYEYVLKLLVPSLQIYQDSTNDANPDIKA